MIITDSTERPSLRFIEVVKPFFESNSYLYHKSKKEFYRSVPYGTQTVGFWFRIDTLTDVSLNWRMQFEKLERVCAIIGGHPKAYKNASTVATDMANHTRWEEKPEHTFKLYSERIFQYDDFSINNAAEKIIAGYEKYTVPFFSKYKNYQNLYDVFSQGKFTSLKEIILAKYFSLPDFDKLVFKFESEVLRRNEHEEIEVFRRLTKFLQTENLSKWLD